MLLQHDVDDRLRAVVDALQVDVDHAVELVVGHLLQLRVLHDARVVDERVDAAPFRHDALDHPGDAFLVGDVDPEGERLAAAVGDFPGDVPGGLLVDVADGDLGAFLGELERGRVADAGAGARDDRDLVHQTHACRLPDMSDPAGAGSNGHIIVILVRRTTSMRPFRQSRNMTIYQQIIN